MAASPALRSPLRTLASALTPHWAALAALGLFLLASLTVLDDYRHSPNENPYRIVGGATIDYVMGRGDALFGLPHRFNGVALELPLEFVERTLRLDGFEVSAARHLLTHFLFLSGGLFAYLLTQRLFGNRALALIVMLLFLLHPRLYAHSFINNKDLPFVGMLMIALFLARRAFKKDTLAAFALLGIGAGAIMNMRLMGAVLLLGVLAGRGLDLLWARDGSERKRVLLSASALVLAAGLTTYGSWPYLWDNPGGRLWESLRPAELEPFEQESWTIERPWESLIRGESYLIDSTELFRGGGNFLSERPAGLRPHLALDNDASVRAAVGGDRRGGAAAALARPACRRASQYERAVRAACGGLRRRALGCVRSLGSDALPGLEAFLFSLGAVHAAGGVRTALANRRVQARASARAGLFGGGNWRRDDGDFDDSSASDPARLL